MTFVEGINACELQCCFKKCLPYDRGPILSPLRTVGVRDPVVPVPKRWSASPLFGIMVTSFLFAKEAQKGMSSPSLEGTKPGRGDGSAGGE